MANVILIGIGITALSAAKSLLSTCNIQAIVRNVNLTNSQDDPVLALAQDNEIPVFSDTSQSAIAALITKLQPDCVIVSSYNQILPPAIIERTAFVNVHYSPLPQYRGRANVNWALINNESYSAITIHRIVPDLDGGDILFQELIPIHLDDTVATLYERLNKIQAENLGKTIVNFLHGYEGIRQNKEEATYCCTRLPEDGVINWSASTQSISQLIRALVDPFPGAYTYFQGERMIIWHAQPISNPPTYVGRVPGRVIGRSKTEGFIDVLTGDGVLRILEVQVEGQSKMAAANVVKSVKSTLGLQVSELLNRIRTLELDVIRLKEYAK
ncbi:MAG TPA: methionyl-tRNA formyltransferase [Stenomitos sp.]